MMYYFGFPPKFFDQLICYVILWEDRKLYPTNSNTVNDNINDWLFAMITAVNNNKQHISNKQNAQQPNHILNTTPINNPTPNSGI